ncbi:MAG: glycosyltransferase family 2 protein [Burkholderiales bacterium]|nr:glycosyltransferase family 2 protein [Burkholderiales bacterium]
MKGRLSVVIPTHDPRPGYLEAVLAGLRAQSLPAAEWELVIVDNRSAPPVAGWVDLAWHPDARVVREENLGLTRARVAGFAQSSGEVIVLVDDDNVLAPVYLERSLDIAARFPFLAAWGGSIQPRFEDAGRAPPESLNALLTLRRVDSDLWSNDPGHHASTPWGAGLCVRRTVAAKYMEELNASPARYLLDLRGKVLVYGGDTDIAYTACRMGYAKGVFRSLTVTHMIASSRCTEEHLRRTAYGRGYSEVLHQYSLTGTLPARPGGAGSWLRARYRRWNMSSLERAVDSAAEQGRNAAFLEISAGA